jgi:hypothetical protein
MKSSHNPIIYIEKIDRMGFLDRIAVQKICIYFNVFNTIKGLSNSEFKCRFEHINLLADIAEYLPQDAQSRLISESIYRNHLKDRVQA